MARAFEDRVPIRATDTGSVALYVQKKSISTGSSSSGMWEERLEEVEEIQRGRDGRDSLLPTTNSSVDQQHRTAFCVLKHVRSSYKPAISKDSRVLVDASSGVLGKEDWALAVEGGRVQGTGSKDSGSTWGEGLEKKIEELQRERDGRGSLLATTDRRVDQQHRTIFCALKHVRSSYKPAIFMDSEFLWMLHREFLGRMTGPLPLEVAGSGVWEVTVVVVREVRG